MANDFKNGNDWFSKPDSNLLNGGSKIESNAYYRTPRDGNLNMPVKDASSFYSSSGDLSRTTGEKSASSFFHTPGGDVLEKKANFFAKDMTIEEMKEYVKRHTSGVKLETMLTSGGGGRIATFEKFVEMVRDGYNIVKANVLNYDMIDVKYQIRLSNDMKKGGR